MEKLPVLLLIFCRKDNTLEMFKSVKEYEPSRLYIAADGPRSDKPGEKEACLETRQALLDEIDWECEVKTLFRETNLGCANAVYSAICWFFENEEWGIIIEDDIILSQDFYKMCEELLPRYKDVERIQQISAQNYNTKCTESNTYTFQKTTYIWGWATWRKSWNKYMDMSMSKYPDFKMISLVKYYGLYQTFKTFCHWNKAYHHLSTCTSWATRWHFAGAVNDLICICPKTNLALNIGCTGEGGTHYAANSTDPYKKLKIGKLLFPLEHPAKMKLDMKQLRIDNADFIRVRIIGFLDKMKRLYEKIFRVPDSRHCM
ncbi:MAG: glycosyltransferase family 25 protein [Prevotella sp.]|nr:glycosyltransferase family 25 protein [Prevotella sp.]